MGRFLVSCRFLNCNDNVGWVFTSVFGPDLRREREDFWEDLGGIKGLWEEPWCVAGDFNVVRFLEEQSGGYKLNAEMRRFSEVIKDLELKDLPLQGEFFTWNGELNGSLKSRLERFLVSKDWDELVSDAVQYILPRPESNHFPILLDGWGLRRELLPFEGSRLQFYCATLVVGN